MVEHTIFPQNKPADTYELAMRSIAKKCELEKSQVYIITQSELQSFTKYLRLTLVLM